MGLISGKRKTGKKGFFFTVDALLAASILLGGIVILSSHYVNTQPTITLNYLSQDIINCLDVLKIYEIDNDYVDGLIAQGNITDVNNTILQQAGEFWAQENYQLAESFIENITEDIVPERYGLGLWISKDLIYKRDNPPPRSRSSARKLISGVEKKKPIKGYMSKARANNYIKTGTKVISFSPEGAGWHGAWDDAGEAVIDKYFEIPDEHDIESAEIYISLHIEDDGSDWEVININSGSCTIDRDEIFFLGGEGTFDIHDITGCINKGENQIRLRLKNPGYNAHTHPGMLIKYDYNMSESNPTYNETFSKRYYLDNVVSYEGSDGRSGAWQSLSFYIPKDADDVEVSVHIEGRDIYDYTGFFNWFYSWSGWRQARDYDYIFFINDESPFDSDNHPDTDPVYDYSPSQLSGELLEGTNMIGVYFNNYGDYEWGNGQPQIYSDPFNDPENSSYVEVNYTLSKSVPYGSIKITQLEEFGGFADWEKDISFSFPSQAVSIGEVFTHIVQQFSYMVDVEADTYFPPSNTVFSSPSSRAVPTTVYIVDDVLDISETANNYIRVSDRNMNEILPETALEYSFYVPSFVGYGNVFATQEKAEADAIKRLNQTLGDFISADDITVESNEMRDVPTMWGPAVMEVRIWH